MPPPNITGKLHMGHALFLTIQDSLMRFWKNSGHTCLWLPGLDHAGLATHEKIINYQQENKTSYQESAKYIENSHKEIILSQIQKMGALPDWDHLTYTLDDSYQNFTINTLKLLWEDGRITHNDGQYYLNLEDLTKELKDDLHVMVR